MNLKKIEKWKIIHPPIGMKEKEAHTALTIAVVATGHRVATARSCGWIT